MITLVIPSRNNLKYAQFAYNSIRTHIGQEVEIIMLDDASTDGTQLWMRMTALNDPLVKVYRNAGPERVGHTVLYDVGAQMATNEVFGVFHADMVATPNYIKNVLKHLKPGRVVSGTRIEPPLHPPGPEKFVMDLGMEPEEFREADFLRFVETQEKNFANQTSTGVFAPWIMHVKDFLSIGGHDKRVFAPMELEDSDLFNRFLLNGFELLQSRDAFVYHMTCRGSRFKDGIKIIQEIPVGGGNVWKRAQDSVEYTKLRQNKFREWWRKWHSDVLHDENMLPIVLPRYDIGFVIKNAERPHIHHLEPWCDTLYLENEDDIKWYVETEQKETKFNLSKRVKHISENKTDDIVIEFDAQMFTPDHLNVIKQLPLMIKDSGEIGTMEFNIFRFNIQKIESLEQKLINADDPWYVNQLT